MIVYSKKIVKFLCEIKFVIREILSKEIGLRVFGDRFYNRQETASYPLKMVIFNNKKLLGYFNSDFFELGFHESLMHVKKEQLHNVIRHELAHYITFIEHGDVHSHGAEFRSFCERMGWGVEIYQASFCLEEESFEVQEDSSVLRKVQKLMALAGSSNKNESEQAMIKSQQLLLKHNIESAYIGSDEDEKVFLKRIMKQKKENAKMRAIASILENFLVSVVYNRAGEYIYLEILGNSVNVEIAEYVSNFLNCELERLWDSSKALNQLKGAVAKNSFFIGLAKGYCNKIQALKREYSNEISKGLIILEKQLTDAKAMAYKRLSSKKSAANFCPTSSAWGEAVGKQLTINPALNQRAKNLGLLIN